MDGPIPEHPVAKRAKFTVRRAFRKQGFPQKPHPASGVRDVALVITKFSLFAPVPKRSINKHPISELTCFMFSKLCGATVSPASAYPAVLARPRWRGPLLLLGWRNSFPLFSIKCTGNECTCLMDCQKRTLLWSRFELLLSPKTLWMGFTWLGEEGAKWVQSNLFMFFYSKLISALNFTPRNGFPNCCGRALGEALAEVEWSTWDWRGRWRA